ncbi:MAG: META domain-containing protein [Dehalococcoidia bacterium]
MARFKLTVALLAAVLLAGGAGTAPGAWAQTDEAARAMQAALTTLGGVPKSDCVAPAATGTPCVELVTDAAQQSTLPRGIARFSVTYVEEPGSFVAFFGRTSSGAWQFWFGTQEQLSPLVTLPGDLLACTGINGTPARLVTDEGSDPLPSLTRLRAESFVLTQPGAFGSQTVPTSGFGWYRVSAPEAGWIAEPDVTDAMIGDCSIHDVQYEQRSSEAEGATMSLTGIVWEWQQTILNNDEIVTPDDPSRYTVEFQPDGRLAGRADCNRIMGSYTVTGSQIEIGPLASTRVACPPGSLGDRFAMQLQDAAIFVFRDGNLYLDIKFDTGTMRFAPAS